MIIKGKKSAILKFHTQQIKIARRYRGYTINQAASELTKEFGIPMTPAMWKDIEDGKYEPCYKTLEAISVYLLIKPGFFFKIFGNPKEFDWLL